MNQTNSKDIFDNFKTIIKKSNRIKLVNGEVLAGEIARVCLNFVEVKMPDRGAGNPIYTVPMSSILYISDCDL
jgi:hypothetical protein